MQIQKALIVPVNPPLKYPATYSRMTIESQVACFREGISQNLDGSRIVEWARGAKISMPSGADDWFVIPKPHAFAPSLAEAKRKILRALGVDSRYLEQEMRLEDIGLESKTKRALGVFNKFQSGDFWLIPIQLGFLHQKRAVQSVKKGYVHGEFGVCDYLFVAALFSHVTRFPSELGVNCPGVKNINGFREPKVPCFNSLLGRTRLMLNPVNVPLPNYGSVTGFIPDF